MPNFTIVPCYSNFQWLPENGENKPGFGAFSITMNPEKQTRGGQRTIAELGIFHEGHNYKEGTYLDSCFY